MKTGRDASVLTLFPIPSSIPLSDSFVDSLVREIIRRGSFDGGFFRPVKVRRIKAL